MRCPGYRFHPSPMKLLAYLSEFVTGNYGGPIREGRLYGDDEPWHIYGNTTGILHMFTPLKKIGKRFSRTVGKNGTWEGKSKGTPVADHSGKVLGFRRKFTYRSNVDPSQNNLWLLEEYCLSESRPQEFALCLLKKKKTINNEEPTATPEESEMDLNLFLGKALLDADSSAVVPLSPSTDAILDGYFDDVLLDLASWDETALPNNHNDLELESKMPPDADSSVLPSLDAILDGYFDDVLQELAEMPLPNHNDLKLESFQLFEMPWDWDDQGA